LQLNDYRLGGDAPEWARSAITKAPWVVVRRAATEPGTVATGIRGSDRSQRYATTVPVGAVAQVVTPEQLSTRNTHARNLPAMHALWRVSPDLDRLGLPWGPTGSVGFELATGEPTVTAASDLDLVVRVDRLASSTLQHLSHVAALLAAAPVRVDCQVETRYGAVALAEVSNREVLVRTADGPRLMALLDGAP